MELIKVNASSYYKRHKIYIYWHKIYKLAHKRALLTGTYCIYVESKIKLSLISSTWHFLQTSSSCGSDINSSVFSVSYFHRRMKYVFVIRCKERKA